MKEARTLKGIEHLPDPMKDLLYDDDALFRILTDNVKLQRIKQNIEESKSTWGSNDIFHVTELIGCCTKASYLRNPPEGYTVEQLEPSLQTQYYFFRGNIFDLIFSMAMPHSQVDFNIPVENDRGYNISIVGRADWLDVEDGKITCVNDLKTVKNLWYVKKQGAKKDHFIQLMTYAYIFGAPKVRIYYLDLGDLIVKEFNVKDNIIDQTKIINKLKERAIGLYEAVNDKKIYLPNGKPEIDWKDQDEGWKCRPIYCPFTEKCHPDHTDLKK